MPTPRASRSILNQAERLARRKVSHLNYFYSDKGQRAARKYERSLKGRAKHRRYSQTVAGKLGHEARQSLYESTEKGKATIKRYQQSEKGRRARIRNYARAVVLSVVKAKLPPSLANLSAAFKPLLFDGRLSEPNLNLASLGPNERAELFAIIAKSRVLYATSAKECLRSAEIIGGISSKNQHVAHILSQLSAVMYSSAR
jgi:plasmid stabilization system protein ParE